MAKKRKKADRKERAKKPEKSMIAALEIPEREMTGDLPPPGLLEKARQLGLENGLKGDLNVSWALVRYPIRGHGFAVTIQERTGKQRAATQRFDAEGRPTFYSLDSGGTPL